MTLRRWFRWRTDRELRDEIQAHIDIETQDLVERGVPRREARAAALRKFGSPDRVRELAHQADPLYWVDALGQDMRSGIRQIRRTPLLAVTIVATLILGIGLNSSVFTILNAFLLRPVVSHDPESFVTIFPSFSGTYSREIHGSPFMATLEEYQAFRAGSQSLREVTASAPVRLTMAGDEVADVRGSLVSCNFLSAHLDPPVLGRTLVAQDCAEGNPVAVLNESIWKRQFNSTPDVLNRTILLNRVPFTVVGVAPNQLTLDVPQVSVWVPYTTQPLLNPVSDFVRHPAEHAWLDLYGRLAPGHTRAQAQAELGAVAARIDEQYPGRKTAVLVTDGSRAEHPFFSRRAPIIFGILLGSLTLILLIVCANVTMLLLSRAASRRQEMAVRLSMGAGRGRLLRQLLVETLLLAAAAAAGSIWLAHYLPGALLALSADAPRELPLHPDWRVFTYTLAIAFLAGAAAGFSPALEALRVDLIGSMRPLGSRGAGRSTSRFRLILVTAQLAASIAVITAAGLLVRAHVRLSDVTIGYDPSSIVVANLALARNRYDSASARDFYEQLYERVGGLPGVRAIAFASSAPFQGRSIEDVSLPTASAAHESQRAAFRRVSANYFTIFGVRLVRGRAFTDWEGRAPGERVPVVISEALSRLFWQDADPVGKRFQTRSGRQLEVIGVAADTSSLQPGEPDGPLVYEALHHLSIVDGVLVVQATAVTGRLVPAIRNAVHELDPDLAVAPETLAASLDRLSERYAFMLTVGAIPAGLAFVLCLFGVYGVSAYGVTERTGEIGVRMALGARPSDVVRLLVRSLRWPLAFGIPGGLVVAGGLGLLFERAQLLLGIPAVDPVSYTAAGLFVVVTALIATWIPARRATRLDVWRALRTD